MTTELNPSAPNLLIVDDSLANLQLMVGMLQDRGFRVRPVPSGWLALQAARLEPPDLILLDINMPGMDGYEACRRFKAEPALKAIPVVFISALDSTFDKLKAFEVGGVDHISKPFHFQEVEARIRTHLELAHLRRELEHHNARLETLVAARTRELAEAKARLSVLDQAKSDFLHLISHEVRTPLNGICGAAELLLMTCAKDPSATECANIFKEARARLMALLDDAMLLTQIGVGAGAGELAESRMTEVVAQACAQASPLAQSLGVQLPPPPPCPGLVKGAPANLIRAFKSLLETAVKFACAGTLVRLTQTTTPEEVCLLMEADGQAVPAEMLPRFFDLLASAAPVNGVGDLGLAPALAERILKLYGGAVTVENLEPSGIRLTVRLKPLLANPEPVQTP